jgi:hypothetical protein
LKVPEARNIVTGTNAFVKINDNPGLQSMILPTKSIETLENREGKTVVSAVEKVTAQSSAETKAAIANDSDQAASERQVISQPPNVANADAAPELERNWRPLAGVVAELAGATTTHPNALPVAPRNAFSPDDDTPPAPLGSLELPERVMNKSLGDQVPDDVSTQGIEEPSSDPLGTEPPSAVDEMPSDLIEVKPAVDEMPSELIDLDTEEMSESDSLNQPENSSDIEEGWVLPVDERSPSEVRPHGKLIISPAHGVG